MITATNQHHSGVLLVKISIPGKPEFFQQFHGDNEKLREDAANRYVNALRRNRLSETMCRWLRQRHKGLERYDIDRSELAYRLLNLFNYHTQFDYIKVCRFVQSKRKDFERLAPSLQSEKLLPYYLNTIIPLLDECDLILKTDS